APSSTTFQHKLVSKC
ncbi:aspartate carbamoyltransferase regulatory chain, partial [Vibrio parahaemolyticus V-223/04]